MILMSILTQSTASVTDKQKIVILRSLWNNAKCMMPAESTDNQSKVGKLCIRTQKSCGQIERSHKRHNQVYFDPQTAKTGVSIHPRPSRGNCHILDWIHAVSRYSRRNEHDDENEGKVVLLSERNTSFYFRCNVKLIPSMNRTTHLPKYNNFQTRSFRKL